MHIHDSGYKRLFSNRTLFRDLVQTFVEEDWVAQLDFARAERVDKSFISEHYKETEADIIYKAPLKAPAQADQVDRAVYFYLLIEFQSTVDRFMAVRAGHYLLSFCLDYRSGAASVKLLPQIFPIVLYNGSDRWTAPTELSELVEQTLNLGDYGVAVRYFPIIVNTYSLEQLLVEANSVTTLFIAEAHYNARLLVDRLLALYDQGDTQAATLLANWLQQLRTYKRIPAKDYAFLEQEYRSREELKIMIIEAMLKEEEEIRRRAEAEGRAAGIAVGKAEGREEGREERDREIARSMAPDYPISEIARLLRLSEDEVHQLLADVSQR